MRKCGFCRRPAHDARTCHLKQAIYQKYRALCSLYRRKVLEEMCVLGLGVGALVNLTPRNSSPILSIVKDIKWDRIYPGSDASNYCVQLERLGPLPDDAHRGFSDFRRRSLGHRHITHLLSRPMMGEIYQRDDLYQRHLDAGGAELEMVSPVNVGLINPPSDWLSGELAKYANMNPLRDLNGKDETLYGLNYEMNHFAYFSGVLGMKENEKYFESFF